MKKEKGEAKKQEVHLFFHVSQLLLDILVDILVDKLIRNLKNKGKRKKSYFCNSLIFSGATRKRTIPASLLIVSLLCYYKLENPHDLAHDYFSSFYSLLAGLLLQSYKKSVGIACVLSVLS